MNVIDKYIKQLNPPEKAALERIRKIAKRLVPDGEEVISYGIPTIRYKGKNLIHFAAFKDHLSLFPTGDEELNSIKELDEFRTSKGTLQFTLDRQIPESVIKKIVEIRLKSLE